MDTERNIIMKPWEVMKKFEEGHSIEFRVKQQDTWENISKPVWDWGILEYRIKPGTEPLTEEQKEQQALKDAYDRGETVEFRRKHSGWGWNSSKSSKENYLLWDFEYYDYRLKDAIKETPEGKVLMGYESITGSVYFVIKNTKSDKRYKSSSLYSPVLERKISEHLNTI